MIDKKLIDVLMSGGVAVLRTDTLYGIVARADDKSAVAKVFQVKQRDLDKALIVLVAGPQDAYDAADQIEQLTDKTRPTSVIVSSPHAPHWLRHSDGTVAYRVPKLPDLRALLEKTGPLVAPSANLQGMQPARTVGEAKAYFGKAIDYYADGGTVPSENVASRIVRSMDNGKAVIIRD